MRPRLYGHILKTRFLSSLEYRTEVAFLVLTSFVVVVGMSFLWKALYGDQETVRAVTLHQMLVYLIAAQTMNQLLFSSLPEQINERIHSGSISIDLIRPMHLWAAWVADDLGAAVSRLLIRGIPLVVVASLLIAVPRPASGPLFLWFLLSLGFSYLLMTSINYMVGLTAIWYMNFGEFGLVVRAMVVFLSGSVVPIWFFPEWFQRISSFLPFIYIYQFPLGIYIGKYATAAILQGLAAQLVWLAVGVLGAAAVWKLVKNKIVVQGG
jgi:ABC-2 type transport system permease protein